MAETVKDVINSMPDHFNRDASVGIDAVFQFEISGDQACEYYVVVRNENCEIREGKHDGPNVTFNIGGDDFVEMMTGKISGQAAFFSGKLRVSGDLLLAQSLENLFTQE
jgi:putative sterol carrier protein